MTLTLRNIGIMAHVDAGKTTLTERMLLNICRIRKAGDVHSGTATTDSHALEKLHGITLSAAATSCTWRDAQQGLPQSAVRSMTADRFVTDARNCGCRTKKGSRWAALRRLRSPMDQNLKFAPARKVRPIRPGRCHEAR
ncbi:hypothetical protein DMC47_07780 [Nostoc sp. 3335mG]|nr:hypothetical protein DMC47_07780 [Nostoc sp. 3335mG]